jgi:hypothetical protein
MSDIWQQKEHSNHTPVTVLKRMVLGHVLLLSPVATLLKGVALKAVQG